MATARLYSLYRLYGKRWVRVNDGEFEKEEAERIWKAKVSQGAFPYLNATYSIRPLPKAYLQKRQAERLAERWRY